MGQLPELVGSEMGRSPWLVIDQARIDAFAEATGDRQWIHVDVERARQGPYGTTIAHGYLVVSLLPMLVAQSHRLDGVARRINYGLGKVRFPAPVRVDAQIRAAVTAISLAEMRDGWLLGMRSVVDIEGEPKPGCVAETLTLLVPERP
jgi:acyl dehydratase